MVNFNGNELGWFIILVEAKIDEKKERIEDFQNAGGLEDNIKYCKQSIEEMESLMKKLLDYKEG